MAHTSMHRDATLTPAGAGADPDDHVHASPLDRIQEPANLAGIVALVSVQERHDGRNGW